LKVKNLQRGTHIRFQWEEKNQMIFPLCADSTLFDTNFILKISILGE